MTHHYTQRDVQEAMQTVATLLGPPVPFRWTLDLSGNLTPEQRAPKCPITLHRHNLQILYRELVRLQHVEDEFLRTAARAMQSRERPP